MPIAPLKISSQWKSGAHNGRCPTTGGRTGSSRRADWGEYRPPNCARVRGGDRLFAQQRSAYPQEMDTPLSGAPVNERRDERVCAPSREALSSVIEQIVSGASLVVRSRSSSLIFFNPRTGCLDLGDFGVERLVVFASGHLVLGLFGACDQPLDEAYRRNHRDAITNL